MIKFASLSVADGDEVSTLFVGVELVDCAGGADDQTAGVGANFDRVGVCPVDGIQVDNCVVHCFNLLSISNIQFDACILQRKPDNCVIFLFSSNCVPPYRNSVNIKLADFEQIVNLSFPLFRLYTLRFGFHVQEDYSI